MRPAPTTPGGGPHRFPGFDVVSQSKHWDSVTAGVVLDRLGMAPGVRFFNPDQEAVAIALCDQLLGQHEEPKVPIAALIDARLAEQQTDGWHYAGMPADGQAWRDTLDYLDSDARARFGIGFADCPPDRQRALIQAVQDLGTADWYGVKASRVWSLWTRYACTAFYAHPWAWNEIGFAGPAYPRGYKDPGIDTRERFEVRDIHPHDDPLAGGAR